MASRDNSYYILFCSPLEKSHISHLSLVCFGDIFPMDGSIGVSLCTKWVTYFFRFPCLRFFPVPSLFPPLHSLERITIPHLRFQTFKKIPFTQKIPFAVPEFWWAARTNPAIMKTPGYSSCLLRGIISLWNERYCLIVVRNIISRNIY